MTDINIFAMADAALETDAHAQAVAAVEQALAHYELEGQTTDHLGSLGVDVSIIWLGGQDSYGIRVQTTDGQDVSLGLVDADLRYLPRPNGRPFSIAWAVDAQLLHAVWQEELRLTMAA